MFARLFKLSATFRIALSLVCMAVSSLMLMSVMGLLPDPKAEVMSGRLRFSETLALSFASMATETDLTTMERFFTAVTERNEDVLSLGLRKADGPLLLEIGPHRDLWFPLDDVRSTESQVVVPVDAAGEMWGSIEICFAEIQSAGSTPFGLPPAFAIPLCVGGLLLCSYYFYLRRVLQQLNPSKVIPSRVREAFDSLAEGVLVLDANKQVVLANQAFEKATGRTTEKLMGQPVERLPFAHRGEDVDQPLPWHATDDECKPVRGQLLSYDGSDVTFSVSSAPILNEKGENRGTLASFEDVTQLEKKKNELSELVQHLHRSSAEIQRQNRELEQLANHDPLTGCNNRRSFFQQFESLWLAARRYKMPISAVMVDIDHFKSINDRFGHAIGDDVLQTVAVALQEPMREADLLCRYGGEEFAVVMPHTDIVQAAVAAERLRQSIARIQFPELKVTASLGISAISESPADPQEMLDQADKCLYVAKRQGRNQVVRWDQVPPELHEELSGMLENDVQGGKDMIEKDEPNAIPFHAVSALVSALAYRDHKTAAHSRRVADLCVAVSEGLLSLSDAYTLEMAALLHDIGKIGVPDAILHKPDRLTEEEWEIMRSNTRIGSEIVHSSFASKSLTELVRGYQIPFNDPGACNENGICTIPVGARILAIADAYDSMTSAHRYRGALSESDAQAELRKHAGAQFDPELVERFINVTRDRGASLQSDAIAGSPELALSIGAQLEGLVAAIDGQNLQDMKLLAERLNHTAAGLCATEISSKAMELGVALDSEDDFVGAMQCASELLDLCRATQGALLQRPLHLSASDSRSHTS